jgi:beta-D-xylosidase 4
MLRSLALLTFLIRYGENYNATVQDLAEYFNPAFKSCVRDVAVGSVMCAYVS